MPENHTERKTVAHSQLGECCIHPDFPGGKAVLYIAVAGRRLEKAVVKPVVNTQYIPFFDTTTGPMQVYEKEIRGVFGGAPVQACLRECRELGGGSFSAYLVVALPDSGVKVTMSPDGVNGIKYGVAGQDAEERKMADALKGKLDALMPVFGRDMPVEGLAAELFG